MNSRVASPSNSGKAADPVSEPMPVTGHGRVPLMVVHKDIHRNVWLSSSQQYKSNPLSPVAGMCGISKSDEVTDALISSDRAFDRNRTARPAVSSLAP